MLRKTTSYLITGLCVASLFLSQGMTSYATEREEIVAANRALAVQSNQIENWPTGPDVAAVSAILMEAETGTILYAKNIHDRQYPASTTKILTSLIVSEMCSLDELVTFSHDAIYDTPYDSNHIAIDVGERLTIEQCLNAILIRSANEVSYGVAEHISGTTWQDFAPIMNQRAAELGCVESNFVNPNGLPDENHYTSAYDLAMIGRAFFANEMLCKITTTPLLRIPPSEYQPDDILESNAMQLLPGKTHAYEYLVGCKTGYTDDARNTLVSCAEKDGLKLICVVLKDEMPYHYEDSIALFDYGFANFDKINISQTETKYNIDNAGFFYNDNDILGNSKPILSLNQEDCIILPKTASFEDAVSTISYNTTDNSQVALISYTYQGVPIGTVSVDFASDQNTAYNFDEVAQTQTATTASGADTDADTGTNTEDVPAEDSSEKESDKGGAVIFINIVKVLLWIIGIIVAAFALLFLRAFLWRRYFSGHSARRNWKRNRRRRQNKYQSVDSALQNRRREQIREAKRRQNNIRTRRKRDYD